MVDLLQTTIPRALKSTEIYLIKLTLNHRRFRCRQATSHYLSQCWPRSMSPYDVTRVQWVKERKSISKWEIPYHSLSFHESSSFSLPCGHWIGQYITANVGDIVLSKQSIKNNIEGHDKTSWENKMQDTEDFPILRTYKLFKHNFTCENTYIY